MKQTIYTLIIYLQILLLFPCQIYSATTLVNENRPEWSGTKAIRDADFEKALSEIQADTNVTDTAFNMFKLGCVYHGLEDWSKALFYFKMSARMSKKYTPFAYERIGDIELAQKRYESGLKAYRVAARKTELMPYRYVLHKKMYSVAMKHTEAIGKISWLEEVVGEDEEVMLDTSMKDIFIQLLEAGKSKELDSALLKFIDPSKYNEVQCYICSFLSTDSLNDAMFSTKTLYLLSKLSYTCKQYKKSSDWLHKVLDRKDFKKAVSQQNYIYHRVVLNYRLKNYNKVIKWGTKYDKTYGSDPGLVFMLARSYRSLGKSKQAAHWYDKHIKLFPNLSKTHDIIWYRAWQKEDANQFEAARKFYRTLFKRYKHGSKADDAYYRYALSYCKERNYKTAIKAFSMFLKKCPYSTFSAGAHFWRAKSYFAIKQFDNAKEVCQNLIRTNPADYYAYRARELLVLMGDSYSALRVDTARSDDEAFLWLDSVTEDTAKHLSGNDSARFYLGSCLAAVGMLDQTELVLEPFEISYGKNLLLQYELARLYQISNNPAHSFRVAKRLSWRIPEEARSCMPSQIYSLLYPGSYMSIIQSSAEINKIEPELVSSIIRQESIFNPTIVSPAGAIGLMQIMPYTGEEIAKDLKETFVLDSLYYPSVNVRYGSYYIKKLLDKFKGSIVLAVAGYNGGPHNAKKWNAQNSDDGFDMFVEDIGFSETRRYVKKVLGNYWTYKALKGIGH